MLKLAPFEQYINHKIEYPFLLASPHSGRYYPDYFLNSSILSHFELRHFEDSYVDEFLEGLKIENIPLIFANYARSYIDLNRSIKTLDPLIIKNSGNFMPDGNTRSGFGIIPRQIGYNKEIYNEKMSLSEANFRIDNIYKPYHASIKENIANIKNVFGKCIFLDVHSMPKDALGSHDYDIIIGDVFETSCNINLSYILTSMFKNAGFKVRKNYPYAGGYSTKHYGKPKHMQHSLQIEINRSIYMNEASLDKFENFREIAGKIKTILMQFIIEGSKII